MGALQKYVIVVESSAPPHVVLCQNIGGGIVKELKEIEVELVSASKLAEKYDLCAATIRDKLSSINQGTQGKALYDPRRAHELLTAKSKRGRPRVN